MSSVAFGLACLGYMLLSFSLIRHYRQVWPESTDYSQWSLCNRIVGYTLLCIALVPCVVAYGLLSGLIAWITILALAAMLQAILIKFWPSRSLLFGGASVALVFVGLLAGLIA